MSDILKGLEPERVFHFFEKISAIPRGSCNTKAISDFCENFAKSHELDYVREKCGNIIIKKDASAGCKSLESVLIQGHLDMVWEKSADCDINFETEGLRLNKDEEFVFAEGTTLGGDDGIAVAMGLALLDDDDIVHPPLEVLFTVDEEVGMTGAYELDASNIYSRRLINLDSEEEGTLLAGCAGGARVEIKLNFEKHEKEMPAYKLTLSGLHGGHSGADIHIGYANANKVMGKILSEISNDLKLVSINGGTMDNAITRSCSAVIIADSLKDINSILVDYQFKEPFINFTVENCNSYSHYSVEDSKKIISLINELPNGVISMSEDIDGLVETSLNLGIIKTKDEGVRLTFSVRSSINEKKEKLINNLKDIALKFGAKFSDYGRYPAWEFKKKSDFRDKIVSIYKKMFKKELKVSVIHAGLECGLFSEKIKGLDAVSVGPDIIDIHTPSEKLNIASVQRTWEFLLKILSEI